ncbi:MAG: 2-oxo acid dehydrogenase subunit E2 [Spirochaetaceae bacterium]
MNVMNLVQSINNALDIALSENENVIIYGEDVGVEGGVFRVTAGLQEKYGERRVSDSPLAESGIRLTYLPFFLKALSRALADFPVLNGELDIENNKLIYKNYYNIGVAVDTKDGLVVPVIRDADAKDISQIAGEIEEKVRKARERTLSLEDFRDGTFTITSYGSIGGLWGTAVINYPQAGILGIGRIHEQPIVRDGEVTAGTVLPVSLTVDHRIVDGGSSTRFMNTFLSYVSSPIDMFIR